MYRFLFRSRWLAVGWVFLTLASVAGFMAEGGGKDSIDAAAEDIRAQQRQVEGLAEAEPNVLEIDASELAEQPAAAVLVPPGDEGAGEEEGDTYIVLDGSEPIEEATEAELAP
ncbi:MAG: hypothetical protein RIQ46_146 [Pseudomonadota bacterium]|jgi:hypothetical protein